MTKFDAAGRLAYKIPDATLSEPTVSYTYYPTGQRATMQDASGRTEYTYDENNRLKVKHVYAFDPATTPSGGAPLLGALTYAYDSNGSVQSVDPRYTYTINNGVAQTPVLANSAGLVTGYQWDELGRLKKVNPGAAEAVYDYSINGQIKALTYPSGTGLKVVNDYSPTTLSLTKVTVTRNGAALASYDYDPTGAKLTAAGMRLGVEESRTTGASTTTRSIRYAYDPLNRLKEERIGSNRIIYDNGDGYADATGFDRVGNRRSRTSEISEVSGVTGPLSYNENDRISTDLYDPNGNTTQSGASDYHYDFENHLIRAKSDTVKITYNGDGQRVAKGGE